MRLRSVLFLLCLASIARAQTPRDSLVFAGEAHWHMEDFKDRPDLQRGLATAVMRWRVEDAEWSGALDSVDLTIALKRCPACRADPATRQAVLMLAEQMRQTASSSTQIICAYAIAREFQYEDGDPFAASIVDEARVLSLELAQTLKAAKALRLVSARHRARFPAKAVDFDSRTVHQLLTEFAGISGPEWPKRVQALLKEHPLYLAELHGADAEMLIKLRRARAAYMGLAPKTDND